MKKILIMLLFIYLFLPSYVFAEKRIMNYSIRIMVENGHGPSAAHTLRLDKGQIFVITNESMQWIRVGVYSYHISNPGDNSRWNTLINKSATYYGDYDGTLNSPSYARLLEKDLNKWKKIAANREKEIKQLQKVADSAAGKQKVIDSLRHSLGKAQQIIHDDGMGNHPQALAEQAMTIRKLRESLAKAQQRIHEDGIGLNEKAAVKLNESKNKVTSLERYLRTSESEMKTKEAEIKAKEAEIKELKTKLSSWEGMITKMLDYKAFANETFFDLLQYSGEARVIGLGFLILAVVVIVLAKEQVIGSLLALLGFGLAAVPKLCMLIVSGLTVFTIVILSLHYMLLLCRHGTKAYAIIVSYLGGKLLYHNVKGSKKAKKEEPIIDLEEELG